MSDIHYFLFDVNSIGALSNWVLYSILSACAMARGHVRCISSLFLLVLFHTANVFDSNAMCLCEITLHCFSEKQHSLKMKVHIEQVCHWRGTPAQAR